MKDKLRLFHFYYICHWIVRLNCNAQSLQMLTGKWCKIYIYQWNGGLKIIFDTPEIMELHLTSRMVSFEIILVCLLRCMFLCKHMNNSIVKVKVKIFIVFSSLSQYIATDIFCNAFSLIFCSFLKTFGVCSVTNLGLQISAAVIYLYVHIMIEIITHFFSIILDTTPLDTKYIHKKI
jgi:hypothetical protein